MTLIYLLNFVGVGGTVDNRLKVFSVFFACGSPGFDPENCLGPPNKLGNDPLRAAKTKTINKVNKYYL